MLLPAISLDLPYSFRYFAQGTTSVVGAVNLQQVTFSSITATRFAVVTGTGLINSADNTVRSSVSIWALLQLTSSTVTIVDQSYTHLGNLPQSTATMKMVSNSNSFTLQADQVDTGSFEYSVWLEVGDPPSI